MIHRNMPRFAFTTLATLIITSATFAFAANISIPATHLANQASAITANTLKPAACSGIILTAIVYCPVGGGNCDGTAANDLILGTPNIDIIQGRGGTDCILGGDGDDDLAGSQSRDVCIGGPGTDTVKKCETMIQ